MFDTEQLLIRFRSIVDHAVYLMAKSTLLADTSSDWLDTRLMAREIAQQRRKFDGEF